MNAGSQPRSFVTTRWSLVIAAGQRPSPQSQEAMGALIRQYWYPLYAYVRRRGKTPEDARDLTQAFFARLIEKNDVSSAERRHGRFRAWLLTSLKNFLANDFDRATAQKRGGGAAIVSLDATDAEGRYQMEPADERTPEQLYERRWAMALLENALETLRQEQEAKGKRLLFERLVCGLTGDPELPLAEIGERLGMEENAVRQSMMRLRRRYKELLFAQTDDTLESPEEREEELRGLLASLA